MSSSPAAPIPIPRLLIPLGAAMILSLTGDQTMYASLATQTDVVHISVAAVGVMLGVNRLVRIPGNPVGGWLVDRFGRRWRAMPWGLVLGIVGFALLSLDATVTVITAGVLVAAFADGILIPTTMAQTGDLSRRDRQGVLMGLYAAGGDLGSAAGPFLAYALAYLIELKWVYVLCLVLYFLALIATWRIGREEAPSPQEFPPL